MATTLYDTYVGDVSQEIRVDNASTLGYPSSNFYNVFGPIYLPRIYGKDLSSFEIASSGKIAVTLQDKWAFDLDRLAASNLTSLTAVAGDSFQIQANSNQISVNMDATSNNMTLAASNALIFKAHEMVYDINGDNTIQASGTVYIKAGSNVDVRAGQTINLANSNIFIHLDHTTCNLDQYALHDITLAASNAVHAEALGSASLTAVTGSLALSAAGSNASLTLDAATLSAALVAKSNMTLQTLQGSWSAQSASNISMVATTGPWSATTPDTVLALDASLGATLATSNDVAVSAKQDVTVTSELGSISLLDSSNVALALSNQSLGIYARSNLDASADHVLLTGQLGASVKVTEGLLELASLAADAKLQAQSNVFLSATEGSMVLNAATSNVRLDLDDATWGLLGYAKSNISMTASNNVQIVANSNVSIEAAKGTLSATAADSVAVTAGASATATAATNFGITATAGVLALAAPASNLTLTASNMALTSSSNIVGSAGVDLALTASSNAYVTASVSSLSLSADDARVTLKLDQPTHSILGWAVSNTTLVSGNNFKVTASNDGTLWAQSNLYLSGAGTAASISINANSTITSAASAYTLSAGTSGYTFNVAGSNVVSITPNVLTVNGGLDIMGAVNSIAVESTDLHVNDKIIQLAYPGSNETMTDGSLNNAAGIVVSGMPDSASNLDPGLAADIYEKSFKWNFNTSGIDGLLTNSGLATEAYWDLRGGRFQMTSTKASGKPISFAMRINELDELEMVKIWVDANDVTQVRRVAKFGRTIM